MNQILIGKTQSLTVKKVVDFGIYLGPEDSEEIVLLPKKQVPEGTEVGNCLTVFVYKDSEDRPIATTRTPIAEVGEFARLTVKAVAKIGAFLDWGLEKDLFLPYKEQEGTLKSGTQVCVYVYLDKSNRLAASMKLYDHLSAVAASEYSKDDAFAGYVYRISREVGTFVAVLPKEPQERLQKLYFGLIPKSAEVNALPVGAEVHGRIVRVRPDGKLDVSARKRAFEQLSDDGRIILNKIREYDGELPFSDNASPEIIKRELGMSKNAFKRALGHLLKEGRVEIGESTVLLRKR